MNATEMRALEPDELRTRVREWEERLFRYRCEKQVGQLENPNLIPTTRKDIARAWTILREKERETQHGRS